MNHPIVLYKRAEEPILEQPKPYDDRQGWRRTDDGVLEPVWSCRPVLPNSLVDLLDTGDREEEEDEKEDEADFDDFSESDGE